MEAVAEIARKTGFVFSAEDLGRAEIERQEEILEGIAGGDLPIDLFFDTIKIGDFGCHNTCKR